MSQGERTTVAGIQPAAFVARAVVLAALALVALAGCTARGTKAGPDEPATVLRLATPEARGAPYTDAVEHFADRVQELTRGRVRVEVAWEVVPWTQASEQAITRMVRDGDVDLALVPARVFDTIGIQGFRALQTPMLIDTPELAAAVARSEVAAGMLAGLSDHGLVGLGLVFEGLRRPMALNGAITRAADFEGLLVRVPISNVSDAVFEALGAVPDHGPNHLIATTGDPYPVVETELVAADTDFSTGSTITQGLVLFPKYDALLADPAALDRLTEEQRDALRQAAADTVEAAAQTTRDEEDLAATYCEVAGELLPSPAGVVEEMGAALTPVVAQLRRDPGTAAAIDAITALKASTVVPRFRTPPACSGRGGDSASFPTAPPAPTP